MNPSAPLLYGLPKIHKEDNPVRPVVSYVNAPCYKLAKEINKILPEIIDFKSKYAIKNSFQFIDRTKNLNVPTNATLVSFDVKSLFTSIPIKELTIILKNLIDNSTLERDKKIEITNALLVCIEQNYFQFKNEIYQQKDGLPMGSPISPLLSEIFMAHFEESIFSSKNPLVKNVLFWTRYVDDVFCIWNSTQRNLEKFLDFINSINKKIQFTMEKSLNNEINFLDINIKKINNHLEFDIYRKPTTTDTIIHYTSKQSWKIKLSPFHSFIHRLVTFPLNKENFNKELCIIKQIAKNNGYKESLIDSLLKKKQNKLLRREFYSINPPKSNNFKFINYTSNFSNRVCSKLNKLGCKTISVNKQNLGNILVNNKDHIDRLEKSGVYKIECTDCEAVYIGQSGRNIKTRLKEHKMSILNNVKNSGMSTHCIENNHFINTNNIKLLHSQHKSKRLDLLEQLEIKKCIKNNPTMCTNDQQNFHNTPIIDRFLTTL